MRSASRRPPGGGLKFFGVLEGSCALAVGDAAAVTLAPGDVAILCAPRPYTMASGDSTAFLDAKRLFSGAAGSIMQIGDGDRCLVLGGHIEASLAGISDVLPPVLHLRAGSSHARTLRWLLGQLVEEAETNALGAHVASSHLAQMMFVQLLRAHLDGGEVAGWLRALTDARLAPALRLMQSEPARAWKLEELARRRPRCRARRSRRASNRWRG